MRKLIFLFFLFISTFVFGQVVDYEITGTYFVKMDSMFIWKNDTIQKDSLVYVDIKQDSVRFKYINGAWSKFYFSKDSTFSYINYKISQINPANVVNAYMNTFPITSDTIHVVWPNDFLHDKYKNIISAYTIDTIAGKIVRKNQAIYNYAQTTHEFGCRVSKAEGYFNYLAFDTTNFLSTWINFANYWSKDEITIDDTIRWGSASIAYLGDSSYIKTAVREWDASVAKNITTQDTTYWGAFNSWDKDYNDLINPPNIGDSINIKLIGVRDSLQNIIDSLNIVIDSLAYYRQLSNHDSLSQLDEKSYNSLNDLPNINDSITNKALLQDGTKTGALTQSQTFTNGITLSNLTASQIVGTDASKNLTSVSTVSGANGGTGVANSGKTITLGGNLETSGAYSTTLTVTGSTNVTLPTSGTLLTNITGLVTQGTNVSITGSGTSVSPYQISASGGGTSDSTYVTVTVDTVFIEDSNTKIYKDASNNLVFNDAVTGNKSLADLFGGTKFPFSTHQEGQICSYKYGYSYSGLFSNVSETYNAASYGDNYYGSYRILKPSTTSGEKAYLHTSPYYVSASQEAKFIIKFSQYYTFYNKTFVGMTSVYDSYSSSNNRIGLKSENSDSNYFFITSDGTATLTDTGIAKTTLPLILVVDCVSTSRVNFYLYNYAMTLLASATHTTHIPNAYMPMCCYVENTYTSVQQGIGLYFLKVSLGN